MSELANEVCLPCRGGVLPLTRDQIEHLLASLGGDWRVVEEHHLGKLYEFENFARALELVNRIGAIAEEQNHHPDLYLSWGRVEVKVWTHKINGLAKADFVLAAKCDAARQEMA